MLPISYFLFGIAVVYCAKAFMSGWWCDLDKGIWYEEMATRWGTFASLLYIAGKL